MCTDEKSSTSLQRLISFFHSSLITNEGVTITLTSQYRMRRVVISHVTFEHDREGG